MSSIIAALLITLYVIGALGTVYLIGKPRTPISSGSAVITIIFNTLAIAGVVYLAVN